jgi:hypothetical protein
LKAETKRFLPKTKNIKMSLKDLLKKISRIGSRARGRTLSTAGPNVAAEKQRNKSKRNSLVKEFVITTDTVPKQKSGKRRSKKNKEKVEQETEANTFVEEASVETQIRALTVGEEASENESQKEETNE